MTQTSMRYLQQAVIGHGTYGSIWACDDTITKNIVAIKAIPRRKIFKWTDDADFGNIPLEASILKDLVDQKYHSVQLLDYFSDFTNVYLVMFRPSAYSPLLGDEQRDLFEFIEKYREITEDMAKTIFKQLAHGLKEMHAVNLTHGDIKDENVLVGAGLQVYFADFGSASYGSDKERPSLSFQGTMQYCPPEVMTNCFYCPKAADVWALGTVLYLLLHREYPFYSSKEVLTDHCDTHEGIVEYRDLVASMLQKDPKQRLTIQQVCDSAWLKA